MLILSRETDERILIGDDIVITIVNVRCGTVSVGVTAPADVTVDREEVRRGAARDGRRDGRGGSTRGHVPLRSRVDR